MLSNMLRLTCVRGNLFYIQLNLTAAQSPLCRQQPNYFSFSTLLVTSALRVDTIRVIHVASALVDAACFVALLLRGTLVDASVRRVASSLDIPGLRRVRRAWRDVDTSWILRVVAGPSIDTSVRRVTRSPGESCRLLVSLFVAGSDLVDTPGVLVDVAGSLVDTVCRDRLFSLLVACSLIDASSVLSLSVTSALIDAAVLAYIARWQRRIRTSKTGRYRGIGGVWPGKRRGDSGQEENGERRFDIHYC